MELTKKDFKAWLNENDEKDREAGKGRWKNRRHGPTKRPYGDYLQAQDRVKFNLDFEEWKAWKNKQ